MGFFDYFGASERTKLISLGSCSTAHNIMVDTIILCDVMGVYGLDAA